MLKNLSFRTKIAAVVLPPVAVLVALTGIVVLPRLRAAADADAGVERAHLASAVMELTDSLQQERAYAARFLGSNGQLGKAEWTEQTKVADSAARDAVAAISPTFPGGPALNDRIFGLMDEIGTARTATLQEGADPLLVLARYEAGTDQLVQEIGRLVDGESNGDLVNDGQAAQAVLAAKDAFTSRVAVVTAGLDGDEFGPASFVAIAEAQGREEQALRIYRNSAADELARELDRFEANAETRRVNEATEEVLAGAGDGVNPETWWKASSAATEQFDQLDDRSFESYRANAANQRQVALSGALRYGLLAGLATLLAILFAIFQGRSLVRRLRSISDQAHTIASRRLPEVLDSLRNPSEELKTALPAVIKDAEDEIGSMAESFNTVLRASVHTSLEHAQRRAQTVTNMLVNLGRRNQTLIDRQLEIMDRLEAQYEDPALLEELFKLDHLITRMRRNAENLLVLAAEQPARNWSQPVPLSDVLRGATSEVADILRIRLELGNSEKVEIAGRFAVDLSHLVAELVENACAYSPPHSPVVVRVEGGMSGWRIWVLDAGIGMTEADLAEANHRLAEPPDIDALTTDRVGFQVVGRLGRRLGVSVRLQTNPGAGVAASVLVPPALFANPGAQGTPTELANLPKAAAAIAAATAPPAVPVPAATPSVAEALSGLALPDPLPILSEPAAPAPAGAPALASLVAKRVPRSTPDGTGADTNGAAPAGLGTAPLGPVPPAFPAGGTPAAPGGPQPVLARHARPDSRPGGFSFGEPTPPAAGGLFMPPSQDPGLFSAPAGRPRHQPAAPLPTRTPPPAPAAAPAIPPDAPTGEDGLAMRYPGRAMSTNLAATTAEGGGFRRLPQPDNGGTVTDDSIANRRLRMIADLQGGIGRGRSGDLAADHGQPAHPGQPASPASPGSPDQSGHPDRRSHPGAAGQAGHPGAAPALPTRPAAAQPGAPRGSAPADPAAPAPPPAPAPLAWATPLPEPVSLFATPARPAAPVQEN
jgi:signal transduction histidine kinase